LRKSRITKLKANIRPIIGLTLGDPEGIGPEIIQKGLAAYRPAVPVVIVGGPTCMPDLATIHIRSLDEVSSANIYKYDLSPTATAPEPSFAFLKCATEWALAGQIGAVVTAPISKAKWAKSGLPYRGHTDFLAWISGATQSAMLFYSSRLKVIPFTVHVPLREVFGHLDFRAVVRFLRFVDEDMRRLFGGSFRFLVSGLNPHAGEDGWLGHEEIDILRPAVEAVKSTVDIHGPFSPDVVFQKAQEDGRAVVVCWYHDQGLIPFKLLNALNGVNLTLGLPFIRTSPVHGTAFDIAGKGIADPGSWIDALRLAERLLSRSV